MSDGHPPQEPSDAPPSADGQSPAFGFQEAPQQEKYNTQYLVSNIQKDRRTGQLVVIVVAVVAVLGVAVWLFTRPPAEPPKIPTASGDAAPPDDAPKDSPKAE